MKVQRIKLPSNGKNTWILIDDNYLPINPVNNYLRHLESIEKSPNTVSNYAYHLKLLWEFIQDSKFDWREINQSYLANFILWLRSPNPRIISIQQQEAKRTERTINTILSAVYNFYEFHKRNGTVNSVDAYRYINPANRKYKPLLYEMSKNKAVRTKLLKLKEPKVFPGILNLEQIKQLVDCCHSQRDKFLVMLLYETGMRIGEALGLRHEDINSVAGKNEIRIVTRNNNFNNARGKSRNERILQVPGSLMKLYSSYIINEYPDVDSDYVFVNIWKSEAGSPMQYSTVTGLFKKLKKQTGIKINAHLFRHTHASELIKSGIDMAYVQKRLGHSSIQTTINTYVHLNDDDMREAYEKYLVSKDK
ncbi:integrase family protein [Rivularia sp. IAM M-261]|nr:integrase family protein [Calothrix sp. PCC 7716]GJD23006.1 integrase family protein [Rivularia sp. IAM M-261]BDA71688.1 integrase family protein [Calothrix sp. PCC 7716]BDA71878.1 integrase family protein [Calothrix sp. PCC 7716]BDA72508.1 integrase family protein [Calothrix sp. PCC 7716]